MALFDAFTGKPAQQAAANTRSYLDKTRANGLDAITEGYTNATNAIGNSTNAARGAVTGGFAGARNALGGSYNDALGFANQGGGQAINYIDSATGRALGQIDRGRQDFAPLSDLATKYGAGTSLYMDALGVNGADGNTRATAAFTPTMSYNFNLDQGLEAINRARNARGMANSGNTDREAQEYGAGLASREQGAWLDRLAGLVSPELSATSGAATGRAGLAQSAAGIESGRTAMLTDLAKTYGLNLANLESGEGAALGTLATNQGRSLADLATGRTGQTIGLETAIAQPYTNTYGEEAAAQMAGSKNMWDLGTNLLALGTGQYGKAAGSGSKGLDLSKLLAMFGGGATA